MISKEKIKYIRSLHKKKFREQHQQFIIEGKKMITEAMEHAPTHLLQIYSTEEIDLALPQHVNFTLISPKEMQQISALKHPQKQLAICEYLSTSDMLPSFYIALDTIQDPGNFGTILRLAAWFGVSHIIASRETVDVYNPKVVQASMGAIFTVQVTYVELKEALTHTSLPIFGALLNGENIYTRTFPREGILLMGNEGNGIHPDLIPLVDQPITIPKFGSGESLNVAMATGILLSEMRGRGGN